ncbi:alpha/beta fold hydrolase [Streptomyces albidoflavus]
MSPRPAAVPYRELAAVSADGSRLHVEVHGAEGAPAIVLSHGWTCSTRFWAAQIADLARDHRVIAYDQRGHGASPVPATYAAYSTRALADDLEAVAAATIAPGEQAVFAGHSLGGMTLMAAAERPGFRERAAAVLLCSTGPADLVAEATVLPLRPGKARTWLTAKVLGARAPLGPVTGLSRKILKYGTMGPGSAPDRVDACARIVHACPRRTRIGWAKVLETLDLRAGVRALTMPAAVLVGAADRLTPPAHARALAEALPHPLGLTELTGQGHMTPIEAPEAVTARIRELAATYITTGYTQVKEGA